MSNDAFYNELIQEVLPLLKEYGTTYSVRGVTPYDPSTMTGGESSTRTVKGLDTNGFISSELGSDVGGANRGGAFILGHHTLIVEPSADLKQTDQIQVDGTWHNCNRLQAIKPGNIVVMYLVTIGG